MSTTEKELPAQLLDIARRIENMKRECGMDPESPIAIHNAGLMSISYAVRALADRARQVVGEPVAHMNQHGVIHEAGYAWGPGNEVVPLFAAPVAQPATDDHDNYEGKHDARGEPSDYVPGPGYDGDGSVDAMARRVEQAEAPLPLDPLEKAIDSFIEDYEMIGESEDGRGACYTPNANDRALLKDAIMGLLADSEWDRIWGEHIESLVASRATQPTASNAWKEAVLEQLVAHGMDAPVSDPPAKIVKSIIDMAVTMARDPSISAKAASNAEEQQAFEAECLRLFGDLAYFDRDQYGNYTNIVVRAKFDGWILARAALASKPPAGEQKPVARRPGVPDAEKDRAFAVAQYALYLARPAELDVQLMMTPADLVRFAGLYAAPAQPEQVAQDKWRPLSEAPTDGTWFIAGEKATGRVRMVRWADYGGDRYPINDEEGMWGTAPTHYQPLPTLVKDTP